jgi:GNAT superfamily N-acetyltransferase
MTALEFGPVAGADERRAALALRTAAIVEARWAPPEAFPDGLDHDPDDEGATLLVARADGTVVGTLRIVDDRERVARALTEHGVDLPAAATILVGRLAVAAPYRARSREVTFGLYVEVVRHALACGAERALTFVAENAIRFYRVAGFPLKIVGPPRLVTGVERWPALFDEEVFRAFLARASESERAAMPETEHRT